MASEKLTASEIGSRLKQAARQLATVDAPRIDAALDAIVNQLLKSQADILAANRLDVAAAIAADVKPAFVDRLRLDEQRFNDMVNGVRAVRNQDSPMGKVLDKKTLPNRLELEKVAVSLGVILFIYESRPNVTTDAAAICLKSGNAVCLRGGSEAARTNQAIGIVIQEGIRDAGLPADCVVVLDDPDRKLLGELLTMNSAIDLVIPRGGEALIRRVVAEAKMPVLKHFQGVCHVYVDAKTDLNMAADIVENSKCQRPGVCNAMESLLVHRAIAADFLPAIGKRLIERGVEIRGCPDTLNYIPSAIPAADSDFGFEFLDLIVAVRVVADVDEAIDHIAKFGSGHTDAIVTNDAGAADRFLKLVDSAVVLQNASTRFNDGGQLGMGAEIGISTDKLHARGPCGVAELTSYKYIVRGAGQIR